eukprot:CAMPEP_0117419454 /NCGR_PEP_ID=MMETSP0758-20121206/1002_1 /TAXON_ID=63605 /ORGANISM="Percolomonas cosmopolitus, Strain AE-1 (ATCC 50343)" /LENGTH=1171 /DNA_ID=CAMNT_0005200507 /DNA_START=2804 /DNA_END=6316 /DNA_ORIENTATION=+
MKNLTFENIRSTSGSIYSSNISHVILQNFVLDKCESAKQGGAISLINVTYSTLQDVAISRCKSLDGVVYGLNLTKSNASNVVLNSNLATRGSGFLLKDSYVSFDNLRAFNNSAQNTIEFLSGEGGIFNLLGTSHIQLKSAFISRSLASVLILSGASSMEIYDSYITNVQIGAILMYNNRATRISYIYNSTFTDCHNSGGYGGVLSSFETYSSISIVQSRFLNNTAVFGGAIAALTHNSMTILDNIFEGNRAFEAESSSGGALYLESVNDTTISQNSFSYNQATFGGAIFLKKVIKTKYFIRYGGALISHSTFHQNMASDGGAFYGSTENIATILNCNFTGNKAIKSGGAINMDGVAYSSDVTSENLLQLLNEASFSELLKISEKPGIKVLSSSFSDNSADVGGSVTFFSNSIRFLIENSTLVRSRADGDGGSIYLLVKSGEISHSLIDNSQATRGGCVFALMVLNENGLILNSSNINRCRAIEGGIYLSSNTPLTMVNSTIQNSQAENYPGILVMSNTTINGSLFKNNQAENLGTIGVIHPGVLNVISSEFNSNTASKGGTIYSNSFKNMSLVDSKFVNNVASFGGSIYFDKNDDVEETNRDIFVESSQFHDRSDVAGGSFFVFKEGLINFTHRLDNDILLASSASYGPVFASNPKFLNLERFDIQNIGLDEITTKNLSADSLVVFPGQYFNVKLQLLDFYGSQVNKYPGLTIRISSPTESVSIVGPSIEQGLEDGFVSFQDMVVSAATENLELQFDVIGVGDTPDPLKLNILVDTCPIGYKVDTLKSTCIRCTQGTYSILPNSKTCHTNCDNVGCMGGSNLVYERGFWVDINNNGEIKVLPCPNGKCAGGIYSNVLEGGTPFGSNIISLFNDRKSRSIQEDTPTQYIGANCTGMRTGVLCAECIEGYSEWRGTCVKCRSSNPLFIILYIFYWVGIQLYVHATSQNDKSGAAMKILIAFVQTTFQVIDFASWALKQEAETAILAWLSTTVKSIFSLEIPSLNSGNQNSKNSYRDLVLDSYNSSWTEGCPFDRPGYWYYVLQALELVGMGLSILFILINVTCWTAICCGRKKKMQVDIKDDNEDESPAKNNFTQDDQIVEKASSEDIKNDEEDSSSPNNSIYGSEKQLIDHGSMTGKAVSEKSKKSKILNLLKKVYAKGYSYLEPASFMRTW